MTECPGEPPGNGTDPGTGDERSGRGSLTTTVVAALDTMGLVLVSVIVIVVVSGDDAQEQAAAPGLEPEVEPDHQAPLPPVELEGFDDAPPVDPAEYQGRPLVLNFWATWCDPCREEMPHLQEFSTAYGDQVPVLGGDVQDAPSNAAEFVDELGNTDESPVDENGSDLQQNT